MEEAKDAIAGCGACGPSPAGLRRLFPRSRLSPASSCQTTPESAQTSSPAIHPSLPLQRPLRHRTPPFHSLRWCRSRSNASGHHARSSCSCCSLLTPDSPKDRSPNRHRSLSHPSLFVTHRSYGCNSAVCVTPAVWDLRYDPVSYVTCLVRVGYFVGSSGGG